MKKVTFKDRENGKIDVLVDGTTQGCLEKSADDQNWVFWFDGVYGLSSVDYESSLEESKQEIIDDFTLNE